MICISNVGRKNNTCWLVIVTHGEEVYTTKKDSSYSSRAHEAKESNN